MVLQSHLVYVVAIVFMVTSSFSFLGGTSAFAEASPDSEDSAMSVIHDIYELLLQRAALEDRLGDANTMFHQVVRKSSRSPSLRLRFGRRADPSAEVVDGGHPHPSVAESKGQWPDQRAFP